VIATRCIGGGCLGYVYDPRLDYCDTCWERIRDLVTEAAEELIEAAKLILAGMDD
jgi:hypothetical protein